MKNKKMILIFLTLLLSSNVIANDVIYKTFQIAITNHHFASLNTFTTQAWCNSCRCELHLDKEVIQPGETAYGTLTSDIEFYCSIRWSTVSMMGGEKHSFDQEIAVNYENIRNYGQNCDVQQTEQKIAIVQNVIDVK